MTNPARRAQLLGSARRVPVVLLSAACLLPVTATTAPAASFEAVTEAGAPRVAASAARATNTLYVLGGQATITKEWFRSGNTYSARYSGKLSDYPGDGRHVRLYVSANGGPTPFRIQRRASGGQSVRFSSAWFPADRLVVQLCAYDGGRQIHCGGVW